MICLTMNTTTPTSSEPWPTTKAERRHLHISLQDTPIVTGVKDQLKQRSQASSGRLLRGSSRQSRFYHRVLANKIARPLALVCSEETLLLQLTVRSAGNDLALSTLVSLSVQEPVTSHKASPSWSLVVPCHCHPGRLESSGQEPVIRLPNSHDLI